MNKLIAQLLLITIFISSPFTIFAETSLGTGVGALLGGDLTDPEDDAVDGSGTFAGFDFITINSSDKPFFNNEGSYNIFDNKVGPNNAKWCCSGPAQTVAVQFTNQYTLTHFTITSGNDVPNRDPDIWHIEGSNDGVTWTSIYSYEVDGTSPFTSRLEVLRYDGSGADFVTPTRYSWFRYHVESIVGGSLHQINEIEFFGNVYVAPVPTLNQWAIILLSILLGLVMFWYKPNTLYKQN